MKKAFYYTLTIAFTIWILIGAKNFITSDPLLSYRKEDAEKGRIAILLKDVDYFQYQNDKLVSKAFIDALKITKNRDQLEFDNIKNGVYYSEEDEEIQFEAAKGTWDTNQRKLKGREKVRVRTQDIDVTSDKFEFDEENEKLTIPSTLKGKLYDGDLEAYKLIYMTALKSYEVGPVTWSGHIEDVEAGLDKAQAQAKKTQDPIDLLKKPNKEKINREEPKERQRWTIKAASGSRPPGDKEIWKKGQATDGDILIMADLIERNVKTDVLTATGNVRYYSEDTNMICDQATVYREEKKAILEKNVQAFVKPKEKAKLEVVKLIRTEPQSSRQIPKVIPKPVPTDPKEKELDKEIRSGDSKRKYPIQIWASKITYYYKKGERRADIDGNPQARQELANKRWRHIWTHHAFYDGEKETLKLISSEGKKETRVRTSIGDDLMAKWFQLSTKEDVEEWEGAGIEGDVFVDPEEESTNQEDSPQTETTTPQSQDQNVA